MIPLYILGLLGRFGPQHGYQLKKLVEEQLEDFTQMKLPTIYYHLEKMEIAGLVCVQTGKDGARPEKRVYSISAQGRKHFGILLRQTMDIHYRPIFDVDAAFYFSDSLQSSELVSSLEKHREKLTESLRHIQEHRGLTLPHLPAGMRQSADIIFEHHTAHYCAEIEWASKAIQSIREGENDDKNKGG